MIIIWEWTWNHYSPPSDRRQRGRRRRRRIHRKPDIISICVRHCRDRSLNMYSRICTWSPSRMLCNILRIAHAHGMMTQAKRSVKSLQIMINDHRSGVKSLLTLATNMNSHLEEWPLAGGRDPQPWNYWYPSPWQIVEDTHEWKGANGWFGPVFKFAMCLSVG